MRNGLIQKKRSWMKSPIVTIFLLVLVGWSGFVVVKTFFKFKEARAYRNEYKSQYNDLRIKHEELNQKNSRLNTDRGVEEEIRNKFRVVKPGEELVVIVDETGTVSTPLEKTPWWRTVLNFIGL